MSKMYNAEMRFAFIYIPGSRGVRNIIKSIVLTSSYIMSKIIERIAADRFDGSSFTSVINAFTGKPADFQNFFFFFFHFENAALFECAYAFEYLFIFLFLRLFFREIRLMTLCILNVPRNDLRRSNACPSSKRTYTAIDDYYDSMFYFQTIVIIIYAIV